MITLLLFTYTSPLGRSFIVFFWLSCIDDVSWVWNYSRFIWSKFAQLNSFQQSPFTPSHTCSYTHSDLIFYLIIILYYSLLLLLCRNRSVMRVWNYPVGSYGQNALNWTVLGGSPFNTRHHSCLLLYSIWADLLQYYYYYSADIEVSCECEIILLYHIVKMYSFEQFSADQLSHPVMSTFLLILNWFVTLLFLLLLMMMMVVVALMMMMATYTCSDVEDASVDTEDRDCKKILSQSYWWNVYDCVDFRLATDDVLVSKEDPIIL